MIQTPAQAGNRAGESERYGALVGTQPRMGSNLASAVSRDHKQSAVFILGQRPQRFVIDWKQPPPRRLNLAKIS
eukprot:1000351-Karenia_brevis.AAC.1